MHTGQGYVHQIRLNALGQTEVWIDCPDSLIPSAGQYLLAYAPEDQEAPLATCLFPAEFPDSGFWAASPIPSNWLPGTQLELRGVIGQGFSDFSGARRISVVSLTDNPARVLPLATQASQEGAAVTLFANPPLPSLPAWLEIYPLASLAELIDWPDFMAIDLTLDHLPALREILGLVNGQILPCPTQVLIYTAMPCAGLAECAACAVLTRRGWKLVCTDGPVFELSNLEW